MKHEIEVWGLRTRGRGSEKWFYQHINSITPRLHRAKHRAPRTTIPPKSDSNDSTDSSDSSDSTDSTDSTDSSDSNDSNDSSDSSDSTFLQSTEFKSEEMVLSTHQLHDSKTP